MCLAGVSYMNMFAYETQIQKASTDLWQHFAPISQFAIDAQDDATFPQFALIEPASSAGLDEHPSDSDGSPVNVQDWCLLRAEHDHRSIHAKRQPGTIPL